MTTELMPLLRSRGINLSESQVYRLVTATPERIPARTFAALCDILDCTPNDLFEPFVEMRAAATAIAPQRSEDLGIQPGNPIAKRIRLVTPEDGEWAMQSGGPDPLAGPCNRCGQHHQTVARWPDGGVCGYCYQQAKRTRGICACGHEGVLPGLIDSQPACRRCSGIRLNIDCRTCGAEDEIHSGGRCWTCVLGNAVDDLLTDPATGSIANDLIPLAAALKSMKRANSGLTWILQKHVTAFLCNLAVAREISHETFDELPDSRAREYVRGLLTEHGVLPQRDELRRRSESWARQALERVRDPQNRDVIRRYIRWHHQRRMNTDEVAMAHSCAPNRKLLWPSTC